MANNHFLSLPEQVLDELQTSEMVLLVGGVSFNEAVNNGSGLCTGNNNASGACGGVNNGTGRCDGINNNSGLCGSF